MQIAVKSCRKNTETRAKVYLFIYLFWVYSDYHYDCMTHFRA